MDPDDLVTDRGFGEWERLLNEGCKFPPAASERECQVVERGKYNKSIKRTPVSEIQWRMGVPLTKSEGLAGESLL